MKDSEGFVPLPRASWHSSRHLRLPSAPSVKARSAPQVAERRANDAPSRCSTMPGSEGSVAAHTFDCQTTTRAGVG